MKKLIYVLPLLVFAFPALAENHEVVSGITDKSYVSFAKALCIGIAVL